jgi:hypothetical protein
MRIRRLLLVCALLAAIPGAAQAQDFGIMESAETINKGNFKLRVNPILIFGKHQDTRAGVAALVGYGFTPRFDAEGGVALYDGATFFGGNFEYWAVRRDPIDFSIAAGLHHRHGSKTFDATGLDLTFLPSKHLTDKLDLYGGLDFAFEWIAEKHGGGSFKTAHVVPGLEYRAHRDLDVIIELGLGLNDAARHYLAGGIAYYFR